MNNLYVYSNGWRFAQRPPYSQIVISSLSTYVCDGVSKAIDCIRLNIKRNIEIEAKALIMEQPNAHTSNRIRS